MNRRIWRIALATVAVASLAASAASAAPKLKDPFVGNWELDASKSSAVGRPAPKSGHLSVTTGKEGSKHVVDVTLDGGTSVHYEYVITEEGENVPVTGNTYFDSATFVRADKNTLIRTERRNGAVVGVTTVELAKDGKSFSGSAKGNLPDGKQFTSTTVWNRTKK